MAHELIWIFLAIVFFISELFINGKSLFFFSFAAILTGVLSLFVLSWFKKIFKINFAYNTKNSDQELSDNFMGKIATAHTHITAHKQGLVEFSGTLWKAISSEDIKKGEQVEIIKNDNITLIIKPYSIKK